MNKRSMGGQTIVQLEINYSKKICKNSHLRIWGWGGDGVGWGWGWGWVGVGPCAAVGDDNCLYQFLTYLFILYRVDKFIDY